MDTIVSETFEMLRPHLSPVLFTPAAVRQLEEVARRVVPLPAVRLGFECRLGADASQVDLQQGILADDGEALVVLRFIDRILPTMPPPVAQVWRRVRTLCQSWADTTSVLHHGLRDLWLEFDVVGESSSQHGVPSIFFGLRDEVSRPRERLDVTKSALRILTEDRIPEPVQHTLWHCCEACPPSAGPTHVGLMLSRPANLLRLNLVGFSLEDARSYLERVGWPGPLAEASALFDRLMRLPVKVRLCLDVGAQVQPTLGFECLFGDEHGAEHMASFLDNLVNEGLCAPDKRDALLAWPGCITPPSYARAWPTRLIGESLLRARNEFAILDRQWSHIKVTYTPQLHAPARVEAKAYFGAFHTWLTAEAEPQLENLPSPRPIRDAIDRAVEFLLANQLPYGEFPSYRFANPECATRGQFDSSPFVTCFVLEALALAQSVVDPPGVAPVISKGIEFLLEEREEPGIWRYWTSRNRDKIDPDADDTSCASFTLRRFTGESRIAGNQALILANRTPEGLFKTWFRAPEAPNVVDMVVNANVLLYLGERAETTAAVEKLNHIIDADAEEQSYWYYLNPLALYYMVSRAHVHGVSGLGPSRAAVIRKTRARQKGNGSFGNELLTGLALCTLLNYGIRDDAVERAIGYLMHTQQRPGSWRRRAFYAGPEPPEPHFLWWGAEAMTTALCLEGLVKALDHPASAPTSM